MRARWLSGGSVARGGQRWGRWRRLRRVAFWLGGIVGGVLVALDLLVDDHHPFDQYETTKVIPQSRYEAMGSAGDGVSMDGLAAPAPSSAPRQGGEYPGLDRWEQRYRDQAERGERQQQLLDNLAQRSPLEEEEVQAQTLGEGDDQAVAAAELAPIFAPQEAAPELAEPLLDERFALPAEEYSYPSVGNEAAGQRVPPAPLAPPLPDQSELAAQPFLAQRQSLVGLRFQPPQGYWSTPYIPDDPAMRVLAMRLGQWGRRHDPSLLALIASATPNWQPFDPPQHAALALYLHGDRSAATGPTRLRLQVGIKGSTRQSGRRGAMNVVVVVDRPDRLTTAQAIRVRTLLAALRRAHQPGDRFALVASGPHGGVLLPFGAFRHGPLTLAVEELFGAGQRVAAPEAAVALASALTTAQQLIAPYNNADTPLGSHLLLLVTADPSAWPIDALEEAVHHAALNGLPTSVVTLSANGGASAPIRRLVLAGQGQRRELLLPDQAEAVVERELFAASRTVARALRLRIRLAPQVRLVAVLGAERLDEPASERVRAREESIDRRLSQTLGIAVDRGRDEEGIQMVIPSFAADDSHVILLDLVVSGPGPVADVRLRYKDLIYGENGEASARLELPRGEDAPSPLTLQVVKNHLALLTAQELRQASDWLAAGVPDRAAAQLRRSLARLQEVRSGLVGWQADAELAADEAHLRQLLGQISQAMTPSRQRVVADVLDYLAFRRMVPAPEMAVAE